MSQNYPPPPASFNSNIPPPPPPPPDQQHMVPLWARQRLLKQRLRQEVEFVQGILLLTLGLFGLYALSVSADALIWEANPPTRWFTLTAFFMIVQSIVGLWSLHWMWDALWMPGLLARTVDALNPGRVVWPAVRRMLNRTTLALVVLMLAVFCLGVLVLVDTVPARPNKTGALLYGIIAFTLAAGGWWLLALTVSTLLALIGYEDWPRRRGYQWLAGSIVSMYLLYSVMVVLVDGLFGAGEVVLVVFPFALSILLLVWGRTAGEQLHTLPEIISRGEDAERLPHPFMSWVTQGAAPPMPSALAGMMWIVVMPIVCCTLGYGILLLVPLFVNMVAVRNALRVVNRPDFELIQITPLSDFMLVWGLFRGTLSRYAWVWHLLLVFLLPTVLILAAVAWANYYPPDLDPVVYSTYDPARPLPPSPPQPAIYGRIIIPGAMLMMGGVLWLLVVEIVALAVLFAVWFREIWAVLVGMLVGNIVLLFVGGVMLTLAVSAVLPLFLLPVFALICAGAMAWLVYGTLRLAARMLRER